MKDRAETWILASLSPRRSELLRLSGVSFVVRPPRGQEPPRSQGEPVRDYAVRVALRKAESVAGRGERGWIIAADTIVVLDDQVLGKPRDRQEARSILVRLQGEWHQVITGLCLLRDPGKVLSDAASTRVKFRSMSPREIDWYADTGECDDKAGAYAAQGRGALFIERIEGDFFNVMGFPLSLFYRMANEAGVDVLASGHGPGR